MEDQGDGNNGNSVDIDENEDKPAEKMVSDFPDLQDSGRQGTPELQAIRDLRTKHNIKDPDDMVRA